MKHITIYTLLLALGLGLVACQSSHREYTPSDRAQYFSIVDSVDALQLQVFSPETDHTLLAQYTLTQPLTRLAVTSATHIGFLQALGRLDAIVAMTSPELVYNLPEQNVTYIGEDLNLNVEALLLTHPQALLITSYGQPLPNLDRIRQAGIQVIQMVEWREQSPLARAEWIKFVAALIGESPAADSIYEQVCAHYHELCQNAPGNGEKILSGTNFRGTWYVPSGGTYMGRLFRDAGAQYPFYDDLRQSSIPLTFETALQQFGDAPVWVGCSADSYEQLLALDEHHAWFTAYKNRRVYNWYKQKRPDGANNFWERGIVHPDEILEDLLTILYYPQDSTRLHFASELY